MLLLELQLENGEIEFKDSLYRFVEENKTFTEAEAHCGSLPGGDYHLVEVPTLSEFQFLASIATQLSEGNRFMTGILTGSCEIIPCVHVQKNNCTF